MSNKMRAYHARDSPRRVWRAAKAFVPADSSACVQARCPDVILLWLVLPSPPASPPESSAARIPERHRSLSYPQRPHAIASTRLPRARGSDIAPAVQSWRNPLGRGLPVRHKEAHVAGYVRRQERWRCKPTRVRVETQVMVAPLRICPPSPAPPCRDPDWCDPADLHKVTTVYFL